MPHPLSRRDALLAIAAGAVVPGLAAAQEAPVPTETSPPVIPPTATPLPASPPLAAPALAPPPRSPVSPRPVVPAIDKSKSYYLFFDQQIDVASARAIRRELANLVEAGVADITLVIDSPGGLVEQTLITYSFIRALPARIATHAQGFVQSAATLLFLAGQNRTADRAARFMFHPTAAPVTGVLNHDQIQERLTANETISAVVGQIYHDQTSLSEAEIARFDRETVIYTAEQARAAGLVQDIADLRVPGDGKAKIMFLN